MLRPPVKQDDDLAVLRPRFGDVHPQPAGVHKSVRNTFHMGEAHGHRISKMARQQTEHPKPGVLGKTMRWANRPTFQQLMEFSGHRPR